MSSTESASLSSLPDAWEDDQKHQETESEFRENFQSHSIQNESWAQLTEKSQDDDQAPSAVAYLPEASLLTSEFIDIVRKTDLNSASYSNATVQDVGFLQHSNKTVAFTGSLDKRLRIFSVDGDTNSLIHCVYFQDLPIRSALHIPQSSKICCSGRRRHFYMVDVNKPDSPVLISNPGWNKYVRRGPSAVVNSLEYCRASPEGNLLVFPYPSKKSLLLFDIRCGTHTLHLTAPETQTCCSFIPNSSLESFTLLSSGHNGAVFLWDIRNSKTSPCASFEDQGSLRSTCITSSLTHTAIGSEDGMINIYSNQKIHSGIQIGLKSKSDCTVDFDSQISNLTTSINCIAFSHDSQIMVYSSDFRKDALRIVHIPTGKVYGTFPSPKTPLRIVSSVTFSPDSRYLAIGNTRGRVLLYEISHYV